MDFPYGETLTRERRQPVEDPYGEPGATVPGSWTDDLDEIGLPGAYIAASSSTALTDATRQQVLTSKSLYATDPDVDVRVGDRIRRGSEPPYYVNARPAADTNPFTGWTPIIEIPLDMTEG